MFEAHRPKSDKADPTQIGLLIVATVLLVWAVARFFRSACQGRDTFVSEKARTVHRAASELFSEKNNATYTEYKKRVPGAEPVQYTDVRGLYAGGRLTPEEVQKVI